MSEIVVIGGIATDIEGRPYEKLIYKDSNPGTIEMSYGGVGRNIIENLARMGADAAFVSVAGDDFMGRSAVKELEALGVNVENVQLLAGERTAMYLSLLDHKGDMELALCNMDILERIDVSVLDSAMDKLRLAKIVGMDTNLTQESIAYITEKLADIPLFLDPVSVTKAERVKNMAGRFHTIKPNRIEAEIISGITINDDKGLRKAGEWFITQGTKRVFITLGQQGVYYKDQYSEGIIAPENVSIVSVTGAGDAFSAAIMDSFVRGRSIEETARWGMMASAVAMKSKTAVNPQMNKEEEIRRALCTKNI